MSSSACPTAPACSTSTAIWCTRSPARRPSRGCAPPGARCAARMRRSPWSTTTSPPPTAARASPRKKAASRSKRWRRNVAAFGVPYIPLLDARQGIVHIIGPELGASLPGMTIVCGDSPHLDAWRPGRARLRHRHLRGRARAGHADAAAEAGEEHAGAGRRRAAGGLHGQGHRARHHRPHRHRRRQRPRDRIRGRGDPRTRHGRPHDGVQHVHRGRGAGRPDRAGRHHLRLCARPAVRAAGRGVRPGRRLLAHPAVRPRRALRQDRCRWMPPMSPPWSPGAPAPRRCCRSPAQCPTRPKNTTKPAARRLQRMLDYMGLTPGRSSPI